MQTNVRFQQGFGVVGEIIYGAPTSVIAVVLKSGNAALNVFGSFFTYDVDLNAQAGGAGAHVGFLVSPKEHAAASLQPQSVLPNNVSASFLRQGEVLVNVNGPASVGDKVVFATATGALSTTSSSVPGGYADTGFVISRFDVGSNGIGVAYKS